MADHAGEDVVPTIGLEVGPARPLLRGFARAGLAALALAFLVLWPLAVQERFFIHVGILVLLAAIGATSLHLIIRTGHVSLCHASFIGVGAYTCVDCVMRLHWPFVAGLAAGAGAAALLALAIGPIILRLTGKYFVLITFLLGEIMRMIFSDWQSVTGGANGILNIPPPSQFFNDPLHFYYLALVVSALCVGFCARLLRSEVGRTMDSIREGQRLAECAGVPVLRVKVTIFVIACALAGLGGGLGAHYAHYISPPAYSTMESLNLVVINVIGGMQTLAGPLIGTLFLVITPELLRGYVELQHIFFGIILVVVIAFFPGGLAGIGASLRVMLLRSR